MGVGDQYAAHAYQLREVETAERPVNVAQEREGVRVEGDRYWRHKRQAALARDSLSVEGHGWQGKVEECLRRLEEGEWQQRLHRVDDKVVFIVPQWLGELVREGGEEGRKQLLEWCGGRGRRLGHKRIQLVLVIRVGESWDVSQGEVRGTVSVFLHTQVLTCAWKRALGLDDGAREHLEARLKFLTDTWKVQPTHKAGW